MADKSTFEQAVEALRGGDKTRARELLTILLKEDQANATYWVWMSAAVDGTKERIYCLQTALKLDPENAAAKRGLILLGARPPDEEVQPFPLNRPRAWEQKLLLAHELPRPTGLQAWRANPVARLSMLGLAGVLLCGLAFLGFRFAPQATLRFRPAFTAGPSPTFSPTPTLIGAVGSPTPTFTGPTPLWALLPATYTPTPLYVSTPRQPQSGDQFRVARDAYRRGDWEAFIQNMREIGRFEPDAPDIPYLIGEAYRFEGNFNEALAAYNQAIQIKESFGPAYLGLARARLMQDPNADVTGLFDLALQYDPNFGEAYLERASFELYHADVDAALADLDTAEKRMPGSPLVYYWLAQAYERGGDIETALENAEKAYELDITMLPVYLLRGELYMEAGRFKDALDVLNTYSLYEPKDGRAFALLGECYYRTGDYENAIKFLTLAIQLDPRQRQIYQYRAFSYLETGDPEAALDDFDRALPLGGQAFEMKIGQARAYYAEKKFGSAYQQAEAAYSLAKSDEQKATALYWRALSNEGRGAMAEALKDWQALLKLPASAMTAAMRAEASEHLSKLAAMTPSATPRPVTPTRTRTAPVTPTRTPTRTPTPTPKP
ncbi:MAG: tetratricopeptide repeat protein [Bacteroidota bacterium]